MTTTTRTATINDLAEQFERLFPGDVDATEISWGYGTQAGYVGHDDRDGILPTVGWYCEGGNCGHPIVRLPESEVAQAVAILAGMGAPAKLDDVQAALAGLGCEWLV